MQKSQAFVYTNNRLKDSQIMNELSQREKITRNTVNKRSEGALQGESQTTAQGSQDTNRWKKHSIHAYAMFTVFIRIGRSVS